MQYMKASLAASASAIGKKEWGIGGPHDSGSYNHRPEDTGFFRREGTWNTEYGRFFLEWYSGSLLRHGDALLSAAEAVFAGTGAKLSGKVAGIHWHYNTRSHAAELTAGYNNSRGRDGYGPIARVFARHGAAFNFTCMEMRDGEQPREAGCSPEGLVAQAAEAAAAAGVGLAGENALERYDAAAFDQVVAASRRGGGLCAFTYLRMNKRLFEGENWRNLVQFVRAMSSEECGRRSSRRLYELDSGGMMSDLYVGFVKKREEELVTLVL